MHPSTAVDRRRKIPSDSRAANFIYSQSPQLAVGKQADACGNICVCVPQSLITIDAGWFSLRIKLPNQIPASRYVHHV